MWPDPQFLEELVKSTKEIFNGKLYFWCSVASMLKPQMFSSMGTGNVFTLSDFHFIENTSLEFVWSTFLVRLTVSTKAATIILTL